MKTIAHRLTIIIAILLIINTSCSKSEVDAGNPSINLIEEEGFIFGDTAATEASTLYFKVHCQWNEKNALTNLIVENNDLRVYDEGMNVEELEREINFAKSGSHSDSIVFTIRDIAGNFATTALVVQKKPGSGGGELIRYNNISMDAQSVANGKGFLSFSNGVMYTLPEAYGNQDKINLLYYYDDLSSDINTIASPGANVDALIFPGTYGLSNWSTKNTTRFIKLSLTQQQFNEIVDPVYVVNAYSVTGFRKAKQLLAGDTYSFKDESNGKYGIFMVNEVIGQKEGKVVISIVMQN